MRGTMSDPLDHTTLGVPSGHHNPDAFAHANLMYRQILNFEKFVVNDPGPGVIAASFADLVMSLLDS